MALDQFCDLFGIQSHEIIYTNTVNHFIFACSLFRDFLIRDLFAEIEIREALGFPM